MMKLPIAYLLIGISGLLRNNLYPPKSIWGQRFINCFSVCLIIIAGLAWVINIFYPRFSGTETYDAFAILSPFIVILISLAWSSKKP